MSALGGPYCPCSSLGHASSIHTPEVNLPQCPHLGKYVWVPLKVPQDPCSPSWTDVMYTYLVYVTAESKHGAQATWATPPSMCIPECWLPDSAGELGEA